MILRRYVTSQVAVTTALVLGFLVVMLLGGRLIRYFGMAAEGGLDVSVLFTLIGYNLPFFLELILPLSFFIGLMLVFGRLYSDHEMAVINGSGISHGRIARLLAPLVLFFILTEAWLTLVAKPWGVERATNIWKEQSVAEIFKLIRPREFISSGDYHLYVGSIGANRESLEDVIIIQTNNKTPKTTEAHTPSDVEQNSPDAHNQVALDEKELDKIPKPLVSSQDTLIFAKSATQVDNSDGSIQLDLHQGRRYEINPISQKYSQIGFERYRITLADTQDTKEEAMRIDGVSTLALIELLKQNSTTQKTQEALAELGYRFSLPWVILLALMLATPLSYVRPRQGRWLKLIPAIFIFVANVLILISLKDSITKGRISVAAYPLVLFAFVLFALYLNYHQRFIARLRLQKLSEKTQ